MIFLSASVGLAASIARLVNIVYAYNHAPERTSDSRLEDTQVLFWSVLEAGLGLIAVNLPSIWGLLTKVSPEAVLRSVRSLVSLGSRHSGDSRASRTPYKQSKSFPSNSSNAGIIYKDGKEFNNGAYAMHDVEYANQHPPPPLPEGIVVSNSVTQTDSAV